MASVKQTNKNTQKSSKPYIFAVGRRREAVARVRLYKSANNQIDINGATYSRGDVIVNKKPISEYFRFSAYEPQYLKIFKDTDTQNTFVVTVRVVGGGLAGQLDSTVLGIARALDRFDHDRYHKVLREKGYLARDPRGRERRKVGTGGKARRKKQSPKR